MSPDSNSGHTHIRSAHLEGRRRRQAANAIYLFALFSTCTASGGLLLGIGVLASRMEREGILSQRQTDAVFDGAFQMLTWGSLLWSVQLDRLGPRVCSVGGMLIATLGNGLLALATRCQWHTPGVYMIALGLISAGGNGPFLSAFQFTALFDKRVGVRVAVLAAGFNVAAYAFLPLNSSLPLHSFFAAYMAYTVLLALIILVTYPDVPYARGGAFAPTLPTCCSGREAQSGGPPRLSAAFPYARHPRFWGFVLCFGWSSLIQQWAFGALHLVFPAATGSFYSVAFPIVANSTFVISPLVGRLIDAVGFRIPALCQLLSAQSVIVCMWVGGTSGAQWLTLVAMLSLGATAYPIQFSYLTMTFPPKAFPGLLAIVLFVQASIGFVAWPLLSLLHPFGHDPALGNFLLLVLPTLPLYAWPLQLQGANDLELAELGATGRPPFSALRFPGLAEVVAPRRSSMDHARGPLRHASS